LAPIRPKPIIPSCIGLSVGIVSVSWISMIDVGVPRGMAVRRSDRGR
jgi:hypothetical protein